MRQRIPKKVLINKLNVYRREIQISRACLMMKLSTFEVVQMKHDT